MTLKQKQARMKQIEASMRLLVHNTHFQDYVENLRLMREVAVEDSCADAVIKCPRRHMAAIGSIRTYTELIQMAEGLLTAPPVEESTPE